MVVGGEWEDDMMRADNNFKLNSLAKQLKNSPWV